jgi:molybdate transport system substrate-binding protein
VGRYTLQVLERAGLWQSLQPKFVPADSVRQVLDYVARGEVDAGFVYRTDATMLPEAVRVVLTATGHAPVRCPAAVVSDSRNKVLALAFVEYLASPGAQAVLARHGFGPP